MRHWTLLLSKMQYFKNNHEIKCINYDEKRWEEKKPGIYTKVLITTPLVL
jgi:hypothetical protein